MTKKITEHPLWRRWTQIKFMMTCKTHNQHKYYANITLTGYDDFWEFVDFVESTIGPLPSPQHKLARFNQRGDYVKGNIYWAGSNVEVGQKFTDIQKFRVGRRWLTYRQMSELSGILETTIRSRIGRGWTAKDAMTIAPALGNKIYA